MIIGVPKEIKNSEYRVGMIPAGVNTLKNAGHQILIESHAGEGSGFSNEEYVQAGAALVDDVKDLWAQADLIVKVKEPLAQEVKMMRQEQVVFTYFHFAANLELTESCMEQGSVCIAYETIQHKNTLPLLTPMSEIAGRMSIQEGAKYLEIPLKGRGILLGGVPGVPPAKVVIIGGGVVGSNAARIAAGMGAHVTILDVNLDRLRYLADIMPPNVTTIYSNFYNIRASLRNADLVIGAVLVLGAKAPILVPRECLALLPQGAVIIDVAVDQGGCVETCKPTTHENPTYIVDGIVHYCVANMPGAVGRTSTIALTNATLPYILMLANQGYQKAALKHPDLLVGINVLKHKITCSGVAEAFGKPCFDVKDLL
jgi:alanine dehydrogenase